MGSKSKAVDIKMTVNIPFKMGLTQCLWALQIFKVDFKADIREHPIKQDTWVVCHIICDFRH